MGKRTKVTAPALGIDFSQWSRLVCSLEKSERVWPDVSGNGMHFAARGFPEGRS